VSGRAEPLRAAVIGVGALGQHHARVYQSLPEARLVGVYDVDHGRASEVAARHSCRAFEHLRDLLAEADAVSVAVPTVERLETAGLRCSIATAGAIPSSRSTSGLGIRSRNCFAVSCPATH